MNTYKEFQFSWLIFACIVPVQGLITYLYLNNLGDKPIDTNGYVVMMAVFVIVYLFFYGLTTEVDSEAIKVSFGIGIIRKRISLDRVKTVVMVKSPWYYGWGIRFIPNGMLYNVSGFDGVELGFNDSKKIIRIGTRDPGKLQREIQNRLRERRPHHE